MEVPPVLILLFELLPLFTIPPTLTYGTLKVAQEYLDFKIATWISITLSILAQPVLFILQRLYSSYRMERNAAAMGAVQAPRVQESDLAIVKGILNSFKHGYPGDIFLNWFDQYGQTIRVKIFSENRVFTTEPEHIKAILATHFNDFEKGSLLFEQWKTFLGVGIFNSDDETWKFHRSMTRPFFNKERISDFEVFGKHADDAISRIKNRLEEGYPVEFQDVVARFTLDSATEFLLGKDVCSMDAGLPYPDSSPLANSSSFINHPSTKFVRAFQQGQELIAARSRTGLYWRLLNPWVDTVKPLRRMIEEYINPILAEAIARKKTHVVSSGPSDEKVVQEGETLLDHLVQYTEDYKIIQDELINILVAGRDTTAGTLTFAVYALTEHPNIAKQLREEILSKVGPSRRPTYDDIRDMKYLRAFVNEVLRLYPSVPFNGRTSKRDTVLPSKTGKPAIFVPGKSKTIYSVFLMHRRKDLWGPTALKFDPDRFLDERLHKYLTPNPFIFLPFNAGPRICLGQQFAYNEMSYFLIRLLQSFAEFSLASDVQPAASRPPAEWANCAGTKGTDKIRLTIASLTMFVKGGMWVRMKEASAREAV